MELIANPIPAADKLAKAERSGRSVVTFTPLAEVTSTTVTTEVAAYHLNRMPQTLRMWAMAGTGPITPLRIFGRLAWPVADLKRVLGVA